MTFEQFLFAMSNLYWLSETFIPDAELEGEYLSTFISLHSSATSI